MTEKVEIGRRRVESGLIEVNSGANRDQIGGESGCRKGKISRRSAIWELSP